MLIQDFSLCIISDSGRSSQVKSYSRTIQLSAGIRQHCKFPGELNLCGDLLPARYRFALFVLLLKLQQHDPSTQLIINEEEWYLRARKLCRETGTVAGTPLKQIDRLHIQALTDALSGTICTYRPWSTKLLRFPLLDHFEYSERSGRYKITFHDQIRRIAMLNGELLQEVIIDLITSRVDGLHALIAQLRELHGLSVSLADLAKSTGLAAEHCVRLIKWLMDRELLYCYRHGRGKEVIYGGFRLLSYIDTSCSELNKYHLPADFSPPVLVEL
ncbi:hypothetical protein U0129_19205 [Enterobacter hormaechei]|uniref:hypothetical protein n=1 Tax=Enterobacter hormaechei TaxID=158836 RepID=UPI0039C45F63